MARGEPLRKDDDPEVLKTRLEAYRRQTAPLIYYYREKGAFRVVDGMAPIDDVTAAIDWIFAKPAPPQKTSTKPATPRKRSRNRPRRPPSAQKAKAKRREGRKAGPEAAKPAAKTAKGQTRKRPPGK